MRSPKPHVRPLHLLACLLAALVLAPRAANADEAHTSRPFKGAKVNTGTVTHHVDASGRDVLTLSSDFRVPDAPAPHWQVVDADGNVFLLQRLVVKDDKLNRSITLPEHVTSIAKVQVWCAWAEALLGETTFASTLVLQASPADGGSHVTGRFQGFKANTGYAIHRHHNGMSTLTLSDDFVVPAAPAPHWQVVDSMGRTYLLQRLDVKGDRVNRTIAVPSYVPDVAKVQIWCAWAEALLGEAPFPQPVR